MIRRLPSNESFTLTRSRCDHCGTFLNPVDLIPIISYAALRGKCRKCGHNIGSFHIIIELLSLLIAFISTILLDNVDAWLATILGWWLLAASWIDAEHFELPDLLTLPLILAGIIVIYLLDPTRLWSSVIGVAIGYGLFKLIAVIYRQVRGIEGLGEGDARLLAGCGAWLGWEALPEVILGAALSGLVFAGILRITGKAIDAKTMVPFGPFLALAAWVIWLGDNMLPAGMLIQWTASQ